MPFSDRNARIEAAVITLIRLHFDGIEDRIWQQAKRIDLLKQNLVQ